MDTNLDLAEKLRLIGVYYQILGDQWRSKTFLTAASKIEKFPELILSGAQAQKIKGIGPSVATQIDQLLESGTSDRLEELEAQAQDWKASMDLLLGVYGIGPVQARKFIEAGVTTLEDLSRQKLTKAQELGLDFYHDLQERIPREEIDQLKQLLQQAWAPFETEWEIVGSYRRRKPDSGDIDVLIKQKPSLRLSDLVDALYQVPSGNLLNEPLVVGDLAEGKKKYMGIIQYGDHPARRLDLLLVPEQEWPFALVYFTGSKEFNVQMRNKALALGMTLNEHRLADSKTGEPARLMDLDTGEPFTIRDEQDLFDALDMDYLEPWER